MALNPSKTGEFLNSPTQRANEVNDPQFENQQGYFPYDLSHHEILSPLFGLSTPSMNMITVPGDRIVVKENTKLLRNQINGNFLNTVNQYSDSFFVSLRSCFPTNYEKLIPNPTKGSDLPNSALPQIPFNLFIHDYLLSSSYVDVEDNSAGEQYNGSINEHMYNVNSTDPLESNFGLSMDFAISRLTFLAYVLSRGQLLDYLGLQFDLNQVDVNGSAYQKTIDDYFTALYTELDRLGIRYVRSTGLSTRSNVVVYDGENTKYDISTLPLFRNALSDIYEAGKFVHFGLYGSSLLPTLSEEFVESYHRLLELFQGVFSTTFDVDTYIEDIDTSSNPFHTEHISLVAPLAYQQIIAQYYTNSTVDNIFNSDLYMQLLRATMYPAEGVYSKEPTFVYNGVTTEYDYISAGGFYYSLISSTVPGHINRQYIFMTLMFLLRRSLRYGDYFSTARPRMLAVGSENISINVEDGKVSPIDVTKNLLMQRYLNAVNYIGSGFLQYFASIYGVTPSDTSVIPRYISHRKTVIQSQITNNTGSIKEQGYQTTNLVGYSDDSAFDVFIDDHGILLTLQSFDVLPIYTSGIDNSFHLSDRFDFFNPMLQNIGDQPIFLSEIIGTPSLRNNIFGYTMRNGELKFKLSRAHGAFCNNDLAGWLMKYPFTDFVEDDGSVDSLHISPDFIRDKPYYLDSVLQQSTGYSPAQYYHFIVSCVNQVNCARKVQATPPVLF